MDTKKIRQTSSRRIRRLLRRPIVIQLLIAFFRLVAILVDKFGNNGK